MIPRAFNKIACNRTIRVCRALSLIGGCSVLLAACVTSDGPRTFIEPYVGIGVGISELDLDIDGDAFSLDDSNDTALVLSGGVNFTPHVGVELQLADLGEAVLDSGDAVGYQTFSASAIGRVFGNRSGPELFGRLGVGTLQNDEPSNPALLLETENSSSIVAGVGAEYRFTNGLGVRLEYVGHDSDAQFVTAGVNYVFGGTRGPRQRAPAVIAVPDSTAASDVNVDRGDEGVTIIDEGVTVIDEGVVSGDDLAGSRDLPNEEDSDASSSQFPAIEDNDALQLQPLPTTDLTTPATGEPQNVGQFDVEAISTPQEVTDAPSAVSNPAVSDTTVDSTSAADPVVARQTETVQDSGNDSDALAVDDIDFDGVEDSLDDCSATTPGIPVNSAGCDKYAGWLSGIGFIESSSRLSGASRDKLDEVIADLQSFPEFILELQVEATSASEADTFLARRRTIEILRFVRSQGIAGNRLKSLPPSAPSSANPNRNAVFLRSLIAN